LIDFFSSLGSKFWFMGAFEVFFCFLGFFFFFFWYSSKVGWTHINSVYYSHQTSTVGLEKLQAHGDSEKHIIQRRIIACSTNGLSTLGGRLISGHTSKLKRQCHHRIAAPLALGVNWGQRDLLEYVSSWAAVLVSHGMDRTRTWET
jgi:hypothetical protein